MEKEEAFLGGEEVLNGEIVVVKELDLGEPSSAFFGEELVSGGAFDDLEEGCDGFGWRFDQRADGIGHMVTVGALLTEEQEGFGAGVLVTFAVFTRKGGKQGIGGLFGPRALEEWPKHLDEVAGFFCEFTSFEIAA